MILTIHERLTLLELMPDENTFAGIREIHRAKLHLSLTAEEMEELEVVFEQGQVQWNPEIALSMDRDIPFGEWMVETMRGILVERDKAAKITEREMSLFDKFVMDYE
jgi:hypothetical protein